ncbi:flotillin domain-containing protein [Yoonia sediminilitoris]|uniref:Flotillin-like protein n=1 Tax=Yoonia sediminilitoris TaxID=1286148 RepID=A0A2T6KCQ7_9RHOB|nr:flotillin domain-containing protein [Yoonia sediminilitoris]PUB12736.1 flotillin-like protein [Yoonia sediminilitoris]RCW94215.1 flotillin-like protein [Yoonia sediminilitoris]
MRSQVPKTLTADISRKKLAIARPEALPDVIAEIPKPAEKINSIKIHQVTGMNGGGSGRDGIRVASVNQTLDGNKGMALQMPAMKKLGEEMGPSHESGLTRCYQRQL